MTTTIKPCERCPAPAIKKERYCKACKKQVIAEAREAGKIIDNPRLCTEAGGRKCRSTRLLSGTAENLAERWEKEDDQ